MTDPTGVDTVRAVIAGPAEEHATGVRNCRAETSPNQVLLIIELSQAGKYGPTEVGSEYRNSTKCQDSLRLKHRRARTAGDPTMTWFSSRRSSSIGMTLMPTMAKSSAARRPA